MPIDPSAIPHHQVYALYNIGDALWGITGALVLLSIVLAWSTHRITTTLTTTKRATRQ